MNSLFFDAARAPTRRRTALTKQPPDRAGSTTPTMRSCAEEGDISVQSQHSSMEANVVEAFRWIEQSPLIDFGGSSVMGLGSSPPGCAEISCR